MLSFLSRNMCYVFNLYTKEKIRRNRCDNVNLFNDFQHFTNCDRLICKLIRKNLLKNQDFNLNLNLLSSRSVKRPICGKSLNCSRQIIPEHSILIIATWSCFTNLGRVFDFSPVFLSTKQIRACNKWFHYYHYYFYKL